MATRLCIARLVTHVMARVITKRVAAWCQDPAAANARAALGVVGLAIVVTLTGCGAQMAKAEWSAPSTLARPAVPVSAAGSPSGREAFVWQIQTQRSLNEGPVSFVRARIRLPDGRLSRTQTISRTDQVTYGPSVQLDSSGTATAVWIESDGSQTRYMVSVRPRGGRFGTPVTVGASGSTIPALAVAPDGAAVIAWSTNFDGFRAVIRPRGHCPSPRARGCFGSVQTLDPVQPRDAGQNPTVTFGPGGRAYMAWSSGLPAVNRLLYPCIRFAVAPPGQRFGSPQTITDSSAGCDEQAVAVAADGTAVIAWRASPPLSSEGEHPWGPIRVAVRDSQGHISATQTLSPDGFSPRVRVNRQGEVIVLWQQRAASHTSTLTARVGPIGGTFGAPTQISPPSEEEILSGSLAVDRRGNTIVVYDHDRATFARLREPGQAFAGLTRLTTRGEVAGPLIAANNKVTAALATAAGTQLSDWTP